MENFEAIISETFPNEIQVKRVRKELSQIRSLRKEEFMIDLQKGAQGLYIKIELPSIELNQGRAINILIYLDHRFPFVFPRVHFCSHVTKPSLSDGRDYIEDIIQQPWSPSVLLHEIIQMVPRFVIASVQHNKDQLLAYGKYHLETEYDAEIPFEDVQYYKCKELVNGKQIPRAFQIGNSYTLLLEYRNNQLTLISASLTKDLLKVELVKQQVQLLWRTPDENTRTQIIIVDKPEQFIDALMLYKAGSSGRRIAEEEVTMKQYEGLRIDDLIVEINKREEQLAIQADKATVNELMHGYQKAIEYYSAISDQKFQTYVEKLQMLLSREDVQKILSEG